MVCERPPRSLRSRLPLTRGRFQVFSSSVRGRAAEGGRGSVHTPSRFTPHLGSHPISVHTPSRFTPHLGSIHAPSWPWLRSFAANAAKTSYFTNSSTHFRLRHLLHWATCHKMCRLLP